MTNNENLKKTVKKIKVDNSPKATPVTPSNRIGRNEICPLCKSGKKYKFCCGKNK